MEFHIEMTVKQPFHRAEIASGEEIADLPIHHGGMGQTDGVHSGLVQAILRTGGADGHEAIRAGGTKMVSG